MQATTTIQGIEFDYEVTIDEIGNLSFYKIEISHTGSIVYITTVVALNDKSGKPYFINDEFHYAPHPKWEVWNVICQEQRLKNATGVLNLLNL